MPAMALGFRFAVPQPRARIAVRFRDVILIPHVYFMNNKAFTSCSTERCKFVRAVC